MVSSSGEITQIHPRPWLVSSVYYHNDWPDIPHLKSITESPILRPDGSIFQTAGYDEETCTYYHPNIEFHQIPVFLNRRDAARAAQELLDVVNDFPFEGEAHKSAFLAALLTPLARSAFNGPTPLFLVDANIRGAGKTLLVQIIGRIAAGPSIPRIRANYPLL